MGRLGLAVVIALGVAAPAQASYLHASDAEWVVTREQQSAERHGWIGSFTVLRAERRNAHGVDVWVHLVDVQGSPDPFTEATWLEHVRLFPDRVVTSHMDSFDYRWRERLPR